MFSNLHTIFNELRHFVAIKNSSIINQINKDHINFLYLYYNQTVIFEHLMLMYLEHSHMNDFYAMNFYKNFYESLNPEIKIDIVKQENNNTIFNIELINQIFYIIYIEHRIIKLNELRGTIPSIKENPFHSIIDKLRTLKIIGIKLKIMNQEDRIFLINSLKNKEQNGEPLDYIEKYKLYIFKSNFYLNFSN